MENRWDTRTTNVLDDESTRLKSISSTNSIMLSHTVSDSIISVIPASIAVSETVPLAPVRDSSTLKSIKYGPGHEKHPSWPMPASENLPLFQRSPQTGSSHRSKSWTDQTSYPKERAVIYSRPFLLKKQSSTSPRQLNTVMEKCEKIRSDNKMETNHYYHNSFKQSNLQTNYKSLRKENCLYAELDLEQDKLSKRTDDELDKNTYLFQKPIMYHEQKNDQRQYLTQADLDAYTKTYEDSYIGSELQPPNVAHHQKQGSYAQSEGYHSYVSSSTTDSLSTPFLDRLRRDSEAVSKSINMLSSSSSKNSLSPCDTEGRDSVVTSNSGSGSSSNDTLKWHGSLSDVSTMSESICHYPSHSVGNMKHLIAHSSKVQAPQRHRSESVLFIDKCSDDMKEAVRKLRLFPVSTYTVEPTNQNYQNPTQFQSKTHQRSSVADRINELENQQKKQTHDYDKKSYVPDSTLTTIQKKALLSFYEKQQQNYSPNNWRSEPQLQRTSPPQPPPRPKDKSSYHFALQKPQSSFRLRRSSDSIRSTSFKGDNHQHSNSCTSLLGPVIVGPAISVDDWVPERPPKNPNLLKQIYGDQRSSNSESVFLQKVPQSGDTKSLPTTYVQRLKERSQNANISHISQQNETTETSSVSDSSALPVNNRIQCKISNQTNMKKSITSNGSYKQTISPNGSTVAVNIIEDPTRKTVISKKELLEEKMDFPKANGFKEDSNTKKNLPDVLPQNIIKTVPICNNKTFIVNKNFNTNHRTHSNHTTNYDHNWNKTNLNNNLNHCNNSPVSRKKSDAASQTEKTDLDVVQKNQHKSQLVQDHIIDDKILVRKKFQEEIDCETLSKDLINHLSSSDRLKHILTPVPEAKKVSDYVTGLYKADVACRPLKSSSFKSRSNTPSSASSSPSPSNSKNSQMSSLLSDNISPKSLNSQIVTTTNPIYLATSESKAKILTKLNYGFNEYKIAQDTKDLNQKKLELMNRLDRKLDVLRNEQTMVIEECRLNDELGENVESYVTRVASPQEAAKFHLHVQEIGKITSLLLSLSGRLARIENALLVTDDQVEKKSLEDKRNRLQEQLEDAKNLKESIDKRSVNISNILYKYLSSDEYADYDHFINMKAKLIMDSREINEKIKLGEEQLAALKETLSITSCN